MPLAYCDESYGPDLATTPVYIVAGLVATRERWDYFEALWRESMASLGIDGIGSHAAKCLNGSGPYKGMRSDRRKEIQYRLIVDIAAAQLFGVVAAVDMAAYRPYQDLLRQAFSPTDQQYNRVHLRAVHQCIQLMCRTVRSGTDESTEFVFDRNDEFGGRVKAWRDARVEKREGWLGEKLGPLRHGNRMIDLGLQAADMLAHAAFQRWKSPEASPWQWSALRDGIKIRSLVTGPRFWQAAIRDVMLNAPPSDPEGFVDSME